jgi:hypothetical protein
MLSLSSCYFRFRTFNQPRFKLRFEASVTKTLIAMNKENVIRG